jgi:hypothetical protein
MKFIFLLPVKRILSASSFFSVVALGFLGLFPRVWATSQVDSVFTQFYFSRTLSPRHCGQNIEGFAAELLKQGAFPADFRMVRITNPLGSWGMGSLISLRSRWGRKTGGASLEIWGFHAVGLHAGKIYDLSFGSRPSPMSPAVYLESMFTVPAGDLGIEPFGSTFRIRGTGPAYTRPDSLDELSTFHFEFLERSGAGEWSSAGVADDPSEFLDWASF